MSFPLVFSLRPLSSLKILIGVDDWIEPWLVSSHWSRTMTQNLQKEKWSERKRLWKPLSFMFYRISQHSTFLYLMNPKFTKVGIIEDQLIDSIYPAGTIYQKLGHRDGAFFSDSKMRKSFHPRLQECLDGISVQERYFKLFLQLQSTWIMHA